MANSSIIAHQGLIRSIKNGKAEISLLDASGCSSCAIKSSCGASNTADKIVEVPIPIGTFSVGEIVALEMTYKQGFTALFWAYIIPFVLVIATLVTSVQLGLPESQSAVISLAVLPVYYLLLHLLNALLSKQFQFKIKKT